MEKIKIGDLKVIRKLGEGAEGIVYLVANKKNVKEKYALKCYKVDLSFKEERNMIERINKRSKDHPNLLKARVMKETFTSKGISYPSILMEYITGGSLTKKLGELSPTDAWTYFLDVCLVVIHLLSIGIFYQDISPDNIMLYKDEKKKRMVAKIIDFGSARFLDSDYIPAMGRKEMLPKNFREEQWMKDDTGKKVKYRPLLPMDEKKYSYQGYILGSLFYSMFFKKFEYSNKINIKWSEVKKVVVNTIGKKNYEESWSVMEILTFIDSCFEKPMENSKQFLYAYLDVNDVFEGIKDSIDPRITKFLW